MKSLFRNLGSDVPASIVVFLVALPLCLGIAIGSDAPPISGIIAGIIGGVVVGFISSSSLSVSGPAAGLIATVSLAITQLTAALRDSGMPESELAHAAFSGLLVAIIIAGVLQLLLGILRSGIIVSFVPVAVLKGMLTAIGILLIFKQLPHLVGYDADFEGDESFFQKDGRNTFSEIEQALLHISPLAAIIGFLGLGIQFLWDSKYFPFPKSKYLLPAPLFIVVIAIVMNRFLGVEDTHLDIRQVHMVNLPVIDSISQFPQFLTFPHFEYIKLKVVWIAALQIGIIASIESLLSVEAVDKIDELKRTTNPNRELIAQGTGNIVAGFLGGLPITSVIVRSSANVNSGGKTKLSTILHGLLLAVAILIFPKVMNLIPLSALAAVLIYTGFKLAKPSVFKDAFKKGAAVFVPFLATIFAILLSDLLIGICIGILVGVFFIVRSNFKAALRFADKDGAHMIRFGPQVTFLNKVILKKYLDKIKTGESVLIDLSRSSFVDYDIVEMINDFKVHAHTLDISLKYSFKNELQKRKLKLN